MNYQNYIDLGFKRIDLTCGVTFKETGYYGYALEKQFNNKILVSVSSGELDNPKLYIKKRDNDTYNIIQISTDVVLDLFYKEKQKCPIQTSC